MERDAGLGGPAGVSRGCLMGGGESRSLGEGRLLAMAQSCMCDTQVVPAVYIHVQTIPTVINIKTLCTCMNTCKIILQCRGGGSTFQVVRPFNDKLEVVRPFGKNGSSSKYAK